MPRYAAQIGSTLTGLRRSHAADLGNVGFNVHFRNIHGGFLDFVETYIDDGDVDMRRCVEVYNESGYKYMLMPDHVPDMAGENSQMVGFAYTYGYIKALIDSVNAS